jgi:hypothetical protein
VRQTDPRGTLLIGGAIEVLGTHHLNRDLCPIGADRGRSAMRVGLTAWLAAGGACDRSAPRLETGGFWCSICIACPLKSATSANATERSSIVGRGRLPSGLRRSSLPDPGSERLELKGVNVQANLAKVVRDGYLSICQAGLAKEKGNNETQVESRLRCGAWHVSNGAS